MKKMKTILCSALVLLLFAGSVIPVAAAEQTDSSYINASGSFLGMYANYWKYKNIGYRYTDSSCSKSDAYFNVKIRRYKSEESIFYTTVGTCNNNPANVQKGTYYGYTFNGARHDGGQFDYAYYTYIEIKNNDKQNVHAREFIKYSRDY